MFPVDQEKREKLTDLLFELSKSQEILATPKDRAGYFRKLEEMHMVCALAAVGGRCSFRLLPMLQFLINNLIVFSHISSRLGNRLAGCTEVSAAIPAHDSVRMPVYPGSCSVVRADLQIHSG